ncbi:c-type cytochrome [Gemmobacter nectariphilus]|uniref:c-type cytochrome n=1 Tax=Gemmobacter nectariphilus TaxID=220343 RepID=UPI0003FC4414|nr:c-type cytochrome [Gemmobacter nectariphilus]
MRRLAAIVLILSAAVGPLPAAADAIGDAVRGETLFRQHCSACHQIGPGATNRVGPRLTGIFGRRAGSLEDFSYSKAMTRMGRDGLTWTLETLTAYVENPRALVSGTRMNYRGMADPEARSALLAYLREYSDKPQNIPEAEPTAVRTDHDLDPAILALKGDPDYGEYLSSECTTCHQADGSDQGIPSITGWPTEDFVVAMHAYKRQLRPHPVMQMMAGRLSNDEIAALAAFFAALDPAR